MDDVEKLIFAYQAGLHVKVTMEDGSSVSGVVEGKTDEGHTVIKCLVVCDTEEIAKVEYFSPADQPDWVQGSKDPE